MSTLVDGDYYVNELGQPIGRELRDWRAPVLPPRVVLAGRFCRVEPVETERHAADLHAANLLDRDGRMWTTWPTPPRRSRIPPVAGATSTVTIRCFAIVDGTRGRAADWPRIRIDPFAGAIEVGTLLLPLLQRTPAATEAMYVMMKHAFALGYRR
jgi:RimJ/RimL family protein N-acetyltransferase